MVSSVLKQAPLKFALAGHSMGGWLALELMKTAPERVTKLCLLNTSAQSDSAQKQLYREEMIAREIPYAQLAIVENSGHMSPMEMPLAVTRLMRGWLTCATRDL